ncbi:MFS transporter [Nocardioides panacisoli]|uniref:MFS transporter n=1 Tax=Nocardioides panacisoli TaxID=627624 RepID=A0ABP7IS33_9ACTN
MPSIAWSTSDLAVVALSGIAVPFVQSSDVWHTNAVTVLEHRSASAPRRVLTRAAWLLAAVLLVAANLRTPVTSLGALLDSLHSIGLSTGTASFLTSLPVLCFAAVGATGMTLARRVGAHRGVALGLALIVAGLLVRVVAGSTTLLVGTFLACAGIALANVLLPVVVKEHFPTKVGQVTGTYTAVMSTGAALGAALTVPIASAAGGWRIGLVAWVVPAVLALVAWTVSGRGREHARSRSRGASLWRSPVAWAVTITFGTQSVFAYVIMSWLPTMYADAGYSHGEAGLLLAVSILIGVPIFVVAPTVAARMRSQGPLVLLLTAITAAGFAGMAVAPHAGGWLWAVLLGVGGAVFPVVLTMFALRTCNSDDTAALSSMAQSIGYLIAAAGPLLVGLLRDTTGSWTTSCVLLLGVAVVQATAGLVAGRPVVVGTGPRNDR